MTAKIHYEHDRMLGTMNIICKQDRFASSIHAGKNIYILPFSAHRVAYVLPKQQKLTFDGGLVLAR